MKIMLPKKTGFSDFAWYLLAISVFIIFVLITGYILIEQQKQFLLNEKRKEISTIADLKTFQLVQWRKERFAEGASIRANTIMSHQINDYIGGGNKSDFHKEFRHWMANLVDLGGYSNGILFNSTGELIASYSALKAPLPQHYLDLVAEAAKEHELLLSDFHADTVSAPYNINLTIPIMYPAGVNSHCVAVLVLDIDPSERLYPLIHSLPIASSTAETLLMQREGDYVHFLNEPRYREKSSGPYFLPITMQNIPAVKAALGQEGSFVGVDYRNTKVLSATRVIPGTKWGLVVKIDLKEVMVPISKSILIVIFIGAVVIITMILGMFLWNIRGKTQTLNKLFEIEQKHNLELKRSEDTLTKSRDYYSKLLKFFPSLVWTSGTDTHCDYFNQTWLDFTGRTLDQELGYGWTAGVHPDDVDCCLATYRGAFEARQSFEMEYRLRHNDGSYHWISDHGIPYSGVDGSFSGYIGSCYDIDLQKAAESELQSIRASLENQIRERTSDLTESNSLLRVEISERKQLEQLLLKAKRLEAIGQIAAGVAHEVRNPLNAILTITEALFRENEIASNPEFEPFIKHIRSQVNRLVQLMNDLLDLGRTIPSADLQPTPLYDVCRETVALWKSTGMSKNKQGILTPDCDDTSIQVLADSFKLQQVFFNLLENAGHHTPDNGKILIVIKLNSTDTPDDMAVVQVIDQGSGIPEDKLSHVFEPFYSDRKGGTGLGLALVRHFIENMGGTVQIWNNSPPPGCTVEVRIPIHLEELQ